MLDSTTTAAVETAGADRDCPRTQGRRTCRKEEEKMRRIMAKKGRRLGWRKEVR